MAYAIERVARASGVHSLPQVSSSEELSNPALHTTRKERLSGNTLKYPNPEVVLAFSIERVLSLILFN
jgi:hypothetical protein